MRRKANVRASKKKKTYSKGECHKWDGMDRDMAQ
jgi:hypothetical protein